jgi:hypothetical protein
MACILAYTAKNIEEVNAAARYAKVTQDEVQADVEMQKSNSPRT